MHTFKSLGIPIVLSTLRSLDIVNFQTSQTSPHSHCPESLLTTTKLFDYPPLHTPFIYFYHSIFRGSHQLIHNFAKVNKFVSNEQFIGIIMEKTWASTNLFVGRNYCFNLIFVVSPKRFFSQTKHSPSIWKDQISTRSEFPHEICLRSFFLAPWMDPNHVNVNEVPTRTWWWGSCLLRRTTSLRRNRDLAHTLRYDSTRGVCW